ncbi:MAG: hypothetical protein A2Y07_01260 [Planctomycetes bacterium GWF2_50_10]|nr:MAG: hypothetical protein A2Y07_01260 [Planctomycetes bacterium GWF2_50_10]
MNMLTDQELKDLTIGTLKHLGKLKFNQIAQNLVRYEVMGRIMRRDKVQFDSGTGIQRTLMVDHSNAARNVGLYQKDAINVGDVLETIEIPWRHTTTNYAFDRRELSMNGGESKIVDLLKVRRVDGMLSLTELMESNFWSAPQNETDKTTPWGVPLWVVPNITEGFNGDKFGTWASGPGGLTHAKFKNWTGQYIAITKDDLIRGMRRAHRQTGFESPINIPDYRSGRGDQFRIYMNERTLESMENLGESQNENLGRDLAPMDGTITFRRNPIIWVPFLDDVLTDPIYMLNFAYFHPVFLKGEYLRETDPKEAPEQHTVSVIHIDLTWNVICTDRRRQCVLQKAA